jgi:uncharacterized membrane protein
VDSLTEQLEQAREDLRLWRQYEDDIRTDLADLRVALKDVHARVQRTRAAVATYAQAVQDAKMEVEP